MCAVVVLDLNGVDMVEVDQGRAFDLMVDIAAGKADEVGSIARELRALRAEAQA